MAVYKESQYRDHNDRKDYAHICLNSTDPDALLLYKRSVSPKGKGLL